MASLRRATPLFSLFWLSAVVFHLTYYRYKSSVNHIPDCVGISCDDNAQADNDAPLLRGSQQPPEPVHLVFASDNNSLPHVEASIRSAMEHASEPIEFHYVGDRPLPSLSNVHFYNLTEVAHKYKLRDFINPKQRGNKEQADLNSNLANFVRFSIDSLLPEVHKAMWVDADTIFQCDVVPMVRNALTTTPYAISAVAIEGPPHGVMMRVKRQFVKKVKYTFNAGVYVVDLDRWRSNALTDKIRNMTLKNRKKRFYNYGSQPPLVLTIGKEFEHLSPAWNVKVNKLNRGIHKGEACLLHWSGKRKPWTHPDDPDIHSGLWTPYSQSSNTTSRR